MELPPEELKTLVAFFELLAQIEAEGGIINAESGGYEGL
jgi:hypothetical protein